MPNHNPTRQGDDPKSTMLWSRDDLAAGLGGAMGRAVPAAIKGANGFVIDSRKLVAGDIFLPLVGGKQDGHDYIEQVMAAGAGGSLCLAARIKNYPTAVQEKLIASDDIMADIIKLAAYRRAQIEKNRGKVVAVTGSVGKTSVKEMLGHILDDQLTAQGKKYYKSPANQNNTLGVPLCLLNTPPDVAVGVYECGMNHRGELATIGQTLRPDRVIITTIRESHIGYLGSLSAIAEAKGELLENMAGGGEPIALIEKPADPTYDFFDYLAGVCKKHNPGARVIGVGREVAIEKMTESHQGAQGGETAITAKIFNEVVSYRLPLVGAHQAYNSLVALAAAAVLGVPVDGAAAALATYQPLAGRGQKTLLKMDGKTILLFDESYNASPASMRASLTMFDNYHIAKEGRVRKLAILGDMKELGAEEGDYHRQVLQFADGCKTITDVWLVGEQMKLADRFITGPQTVLPEPRPSSSNRQIVVFQSVGDVITALEQADKLKITDYDMILVKASNAMGLAKLIEQLQKRAH